MPRATNSPATTAMTATMEPAARSSPLRRPPLALRAGPIVMTSARRGRHSAARSPAAGSPAAGPRLPAAGAGGVPGTRRYARLAGLAGQLRWAGSPWAAGPRAGGAARERGGGRLVRHVLGELPARRRWRPGAAPGFLASSRARTAASGPACAGGCGSRVKIAVISAVIDGPSNGGRPSTAVYSVAPSDHMSAAGPTVRPSSCSGAMYCGVPITVPVPVSRSSRRSSGRCRSR